MDENDSSAEAFLGSLALNVDASFSPRTVMPGDELSFACRDKEGVNLLKIGHGLIDRHCNIISTQVGQIGYRVPASYWVDTCKKRYIPKSDDHVVGVIDDKGGDFYIVNIFSGCNCILSRLAFEGATKRNRPELKKGDVVYARVQTAGKDIDTELTCVSASGVKKDWSSGETIYGHLPNGLVIRVSLSEARRLLRPDCAVLNALGRYLSFEVAVGMNGVVWFRSLGGALETVVVRNAIINSALLSDIQTEAMVDQLMQISNKLART